MPIICPTITASSPDEYKEQIEKVASFAHRIQIDLADGKFAPSQTVGVEDVWWPVGMKADVHLMCQNPLASLMKMLKHKPHMIIIHAEADGNFEQLAKLCHERGVKIGVALLPDTAVQTITSALDHIDHVMIFSGNLGYQGGSQADLHLLAKVPPIKETKPTIEIGWDGGINYQNVSQLVFGGVEVLNVGSFIQNSVDPHHSYKMLDRIAAETGTT